MNLNQLLTLFRLLAPQVQDFLGGSAVTIFNDRVKDISTLRIPNSGGVIDQGHEILLCVENKKKEVVVLAFTRESLTFSPIEVDFLNQLCKGVTVLVCGFTDNKHAIHHRAVILSTAFDIAVARFVRGSTRKFNNVQQIIEIAKNLTFQRYEGAPCTSALIFVNKPIKGFIDKIHNQGFQVTRIPDTKVSPTFYDAPLSYRYVDGIQSAYLLHSPATCVGIVQVNSANHIRSTDLGTHHHFSSILNVLGSGSFGLFITPNSEVDVLFSQEGILRWQRGRWTLIELSRISALLSKHLNSEDTAKLLCKIVMGIATSRHGAIILLTDKTTKEIGVVRRIDDTKIGKYLRESLLNLQVEEAYRSGVFTAAVTSDGMTIIDSKGVVKDSGALVDLAGATAPGGGGRTAAAQSASQHGLVIKISEDGPIQLWEKSKLLMHIN